MHAKTGLINVSTLAQLRTLNDLIQMRSFTSTICPKKCIIGGSHRPKKYIIGGSYLPNKPLFG